MNEETENIQTENMEGVENIEETSNAGVDSSSKSNLIAEHQLGLTLGAILSAIAIIVVIIMGIITGVTFGTMIWRIIVGLFLFLLLGVGIGFVIKTFVPEVSQLDLSSSPGEGLGDQIDFVADDSEKEFMDSSFYQPDEKAEASIMHPSKDPMGGFNIPNDPKILADAVRTVMKKDE